MTELTPKYLEELHKRQKESRVYKVWQSTGLALAEILDDATHKALYIRLAKKFPETKLLSLAKSIAGRKNINNKGAYFMRLLYKKDEDS